MREARPIATQNPSVGLYPFATAFPGHRKHVALQRQPFASAWPCRHTPFRGLPLPSQVTANTLPCSGSPVPAPGQSPYSIWRVSKRARSTAHHDTKPLCGPLPPYHCLPRSPRTRCPAAAALCQRLACRHTPFRGFQNVREARPITTQNPSVGLYRFATAFPGHRKHFALQRQSFASAWPVAILHLEGFKTCAKHGPSRHKTPLWAFTALPLPSQVTANTLPCSGSPLPAPGLSPYFIKRVSKRARSTAHQDTKPLCGPLPLCHCLPRSPRTRCPAAAALCQRLACRHTPFRGFQNVREARPIRTQNPSVGLYRFATAFPGHREHVALQRQHCASAWPCRHTPFRGFQNVREARPIRTQNPSVGLYRFATAFPGHREHVALQRQHCASAWPCRHTPFRGFQNVREARPITTQNPFCGPLPPYHCLPRSPRTGCPAAAALCQRLACRHTPFRGFQNVREARPITTQNPSMGLYRFATAFPGHRKHVALQRQPFASAWPCRLTPFRGCQNLREARSIRTQNPAVSLYRFAITAFPSHREHVALQRQPFASALALPRGNNPFPSLQVHSIASALPSHRPVSIGFGLAMRVRSSVGFLTLLPTFLVCHRAVQMACRHTPFRGFQNVREARPITTQNPSVGLYRFATAFPGHRKHFALQRQSFASAWPVAILH